MAAIHDSPTPNLTISFRGCLLQPKPPQSGVRFGQPPYKGGCLGDQPTKKGPFGSGGKQPPQGVFVMAVSSNGVFVWVSKKYKGEFGLAVTHTDGCVWLLQQLRGVWLVLDSRRVRVVIKPPRRCIGFVCTSWVLSVW
ncbi:hypothetical protein Tco_0869728, partial [Tanacetum coccineum]